MEENCKGNYIKSAIVGFWGVINRLASLIRRDDENDCFRFEEYGQSNLSNQIGSEQLIS